jgi:hypothetical protein
VLFHDPSNEPDFKKRNTLHESRTQGPSQLVQVLQEPQLQLRPKTQRAKPAEKNGITDSFLNGVPTPAQWRNRQIELGLYTIEQYEEAVQVFVSRIQTNVAIAMNLADFLRNNKGLSIVLAMDNKQLLKALLHFQTLLLSSFCTVLETRKILYETLDLIMQRCTTIGEYDRRRLRIYAVKINRLINELMKCG